MRWPDVFVLELSSFQLETTSALVPTAATVLNVTDNHLDRYAGMDEYAAAKARIFHGGGIQVLNRDDPRSLALRIPGRLVQTFGDGVPESEEAWGLVDRGMTRDGQPETWLARGGALLVPASDLTLVGRHNALNALAALALASAVAKIDHALLAALDALRRACRTGCRRSPMRPACCSSTTRRARRSPRPARRSPAFRGPSCSSPAATARARISCRSGRPWTSTAGRSC